MIFQQQNRKERLYRLVLRVAKALDIPFTVGGGVSSLDEQNNLYNGADKISNSAAVKNPNLIDELSNAFGNQCIVVAIDAKKIHTNWKVHLVGKQKTDIDLFEWSKEVESRGAGEILFTQ